MGVFSSSKYQEASKKALNFIKRQMNVNNFKYNVNFAEKYDDFYSQDVIWGTVDTSASALRKCVDLQKTIPTHLPY